MSKMMNYLFITFFLAMMIFFSGCSADKPIVATATGGAGYSISLSSSHSELETGGSLILSVAVKDADGRLVADEDNAVFLACSVEGTRFDDQKCDIKGGVAQTTMSWEDPSDNDAGDPSKLAVISASYRGAIAQVSVLFITNSF